MAQMVQESYTPWPLAANGLVIGAAGGAIGGFLCTTTGTIRLNYGIDGSGGIFLPTMPVTAGVFTPIPFSVPPGAYAYCTLAGGALGTFGIL